MKFNVVWEVMSNWFVSGASNGLMIGFLQFDDDDDGYDSPMKIYELVFSYIPLL